MYCRKCGAEIPDNAKFCTKCGTEIEVNKNNTSQKKKKSSNINIGSEFDFLDDDISLDMENQTDLQIKKRKSFFAKLIEKFANKSKEKKSKKPTNKSKKKAKSKKKPTKKTKKKPVKKAGKKPVKKVVKKKVTKKPKKAKKSKVKKIAKEKKGFRLPFLKKKNNEEIGNEIPRKKGGKLKLIIILILIIVIIGAATVFAYMKFGDTFFADVNAKKVLLKSSENYFINYSDKYNFPNDYLSDDEGYIHRKYNFNIDDAHGGLINEDVLSTLEGISIEMDSTRTFVGNDAYQIISIKNKNKDELRFELENNENNFKVNLGELYNKSLIVSHQVEEGKIFSSAHDEVIAKRDLWFYTVKAFDDVKYSFNTPFVELLKSCVDELTFEISEKNEEGKPISYEAKLNAIALSDKLKIFLSELDNDADVKTIMNDIRYFASQNKALKKTELASSNMIQDYITNIDTALTSESIADINVKINLNNEGVVREVKLNTVVSNLDTSLIIDMNEEGVNQKLNMSLIFSKDDSEIKLDYIRKSTIKGEEKSEIFEKEEEYVLSTKYKDSTTKFELKGNQNYKPNTGEYEKIYNFNSGEFFDRLKFMYKENGKFEYEEYKKKFNKNIEINYDTIFYDYNIKLTGNMMKDKVDSIGNMKSKIDENLDYISNEDYESIKKEINNNIDIFLIKFSTGEW